MSAASAYPTTLLGVLRDLSLYPVLVALVSERIGKFNFPGTLSYWTYREGGDEVIATKEQLDAVLKAVRSATGRPSLRASERGKNGFVTLCLPGPAKTALLLEMLAQGAQLSAHDVAALPPPLDLQRLALSDRTG